MNDHAYYIGAECPDLISSSSSQSVVIPGYNFVNADVWSGTYCQAEEAYWDYGFVSGGGRYVYRLSPTQALFYYPGFAVWVLADPTTYGGECPVLYAWDAGPLTPPEGDWTGCSELFSTVTLTTC
jgi:hypothetical protein